MEFDWKQALILSAEVGVIAGLAQLTTTGTISEQALMGAGFTFAIMFLRELQRQLTGKTTSGISGWKSNNFRSIFLVR